MAKFAALSTLLGVSSALVLQAPNALTPKNAARENVELLENHFYNLKVEHVNFERVITETPEDAPWSEPHYNGVESVVGNGITKIDFSTVAVAGKDYAQTIRYNDQNGGLGIEVNTTVSATPNIHGEYVIVQFECGDDYICVLDDLKDHMIEQGIPGSTVFIHVYGVPVHSLARDTVPEGYYGVDLNIVSNPVEDIEITYSNQWTAGNLHHAIKPVIGQPAKQKNLVTFYVNDASVAEFDQEISFTRTRTNQVDTVKVFYNRLTGLCGVKPIYTNSQPLVIESPYETTCLTEEVGGTKRPFIGLYVSNQHKRNLSVNLDNSAIASVLVNELPAYSSAEVDYFNTDMNQWYEEDFIKLGGYNYIKFNREQSFTSEIKRGAIIAKYTFVDGSCATLAFISNDTTLNGSYCQTKIAVSEGFNNRYVLVQDSEVTDGTKAGSLNAANCSFNFKWVDNGVDQIVTEAYDVYSPARYSWETPCDKNMGHMCTV